MAGSQRGVTLIELLVAVSIFAMTAAAVAQALITAQHARASSERWLRATQLAEERLERLRSGDRADDSGPVGIFTRSWRARAAPRGGALEQLDVTVTWEDRGAQRFALSALRRAAP